MVTFVQHTGIAIEEDVLGKQEVGVILLYTLLDDLDYLDQEEYLRQLNATARIHI